MPKNRTKTPQQIHGKFNYIPKISLDSIAHWLLLTSTPPPLGSSPPYLKPNPSLPGYLSALFCPTHIYLVSILLFFSTQGCT